MCNKLTGWWDIKKDIGITVWVIKKPTIILCLGIRTHTNIAKDDTITITLTEQQKVPLTDN